MAGALLVVIVAMVPLLPETATKPLFFFYGDSYEDLPTDYIEYSNEDSAENGDEKEEAPLHPGSGAIINNGVVVTINGIPFNCTQKACVLDTNSKDESAPSKPPSEPQEATPSDSSEGKEPKPETRTTNTPPPEGNGKISTEGTTEGSTTTTEKVTIKP